jgi:hypothetical protein
MRILWVYARRLVEWLLLFAIGHGIILFLATIEIFPDRFVAAMITTVTTAPIWAHWIMVGTFGLLGTFILERFVWRSGGQPIADQKDAAEPIATSGTQRYMNAYEVIHYLADDSKWGDDTKKYVGAEQYVSRAGNITMRKWPLLEALGEFKRIAEHGRIHAVGRFNGVGQHVQIPETYWMSATFKSIFNAEPRY